MKRIVPLLLVLLLGALTAPSALTADVFVRPGTPSRVMTQNLYVGADLFRILQAESPEQVPFVVAEIFQTIVETDFPERAAGIATEIKHRRPDLIGLQEVSLISVVAPGDPPDVMLIDYLQELMDALARLDLPYEVAAVIENADVELPIATPTGLGLARLVDRDVILARRNVQTSNVTAQHYTTNLQLPIGDPPVATVEFLRGFVAVDAFLRGTTYRFVNTHLEVQGGSLDPLVPFVQAAQAQELIATLASETLPLILVGDLNSSPQDPVMPPLYPPYVQFLGAGYTDAWMVREGFPSPGFSCCQDETLTNPVSLLSERIDLIFLRNDLGIYPMSLIGPVEAYLVGADPASRTPSGLWLSDHAGVEARLTMPVPRGPGRTRERAR
jgi:endonuclease/exonuclease/phosphatase family metal-dependent hydrolase